MGPKMSDYQQADEPTQGVLTSLDNANGREPRVRESNLFLVALTVWIWSGVLLFGCYKLAWYFLVERSGG